VKLVPLVRPGSQKNVPKNLNDEDDGAPAQGGDPGKWFLDIASVKQREGKPKPAYPHWRILVDEFTGMKVSHLFKTKRSMVKPACELFHKWITNKVPINIVRMDNAGENNSWNPSVKVSSGSSTSSLNTLQGTPLHSQDGTAA
jgi:hypothetical protein